MKKVLTTVALAMCAVMVLSVLASAQPGQGRGQGRGQGGPGFGGFMMGGGPGGGLQMLLNNTELRSQLGITDEQVQKIEQIRQDSRPAGGQRGPDAGPPSEAERAAAAQRRQETQDKIRAVLTAEQQEKAKVLAFQISGGLSSPFVNADVLDVLNLTDDQKAKLRAINEENAAAMREVFANMPQRGNDATSEERQAAMERMRAQGEERRAATEAKVRAILTDEQKAKAEKLTSEGSEIRERFMEQMRQGFGNRQGGAAGAIPNSWQPGQGAGNRQGGQQRRNFPRSDAQ